MWYILEVLLRVVLFPHLPTGSTEGDRKGKKNIYIYIRCIVASVFDMIDCYLSTLRFRYRLLNYERCVA